MEKKMTAVQWLIENAKWFHTAESSKAIQEKALALEREQHGNTWDAAIEAHENRGHNISRSICDFDEYYTSTYSEPLKDKI